MAVETLVAEEINKLVYHKVVTLEEILVVDQVEIQEEEVVAEQM